MDLFRSLIIISVLLVTVCHSAAQSGDDDDQDFILEDDEREKDGSNGKGAYYFAESETPNNNGKEGDIYYDYGDNKVDGSTWFPAQKTLDTSQWLALRFQDKGLLKKEDFHKLLKDLSTGLTDHAGADLAAKCADAESSGASFDVDGHEMNCSDILSDCISVDAVYLRYASQEGLDYTQLAAALQEAAFSLTNPNCWIAQVGHKGFKPTTGQAWGYGIGFVTLVAIISNVGALLTPLMATNFFQRLLQFLVAMGAGTLAATGLLVLIPEAFDIVSIEEIKDDYVWKGATALLSIYVFFVSERFLKFALQSREEKREMKRLDSIHIDGKSSMEAESEKAPMAPPQDMAVKEESFDHGHSHFASPTPRQRKGPVSTVAWMVLIGDVIHNFVDGMAIGAAFTENTYLGVSIGIAVLCEELPHELSDVAILLHSGLTMRRALFLNFLSACVAFIGLVVGILLGESTTATRWVLAVAGGLFLYVPLCDMLPEMSQHLDLLMKKAKESEGRLISREVWIVLMCQSLGLLVGIAIIFIVVSFSGNIEVGS